MNIAQRLLDWYLPILSHGGYWVIFLAAILEAMPFGFLVPGHLIVILGGFFSKLGIFNFWYVALIGSLGAILGDLISFLLGRKYGYSILSKYGRYFFLKKEFLDKTRKLMKAHTGKTLVIGRFNPATRSFAPFIAGSSDVAFGRFFLFNVIGGVSWAFSSALIGYIFGASYEVASKYIGRFIFFAVIISIALVYAYRFINKKKHIFTKPYLFTLILNIVSVYLFSKAVEDIMDNELFAKWDIWVNANIASIHTPFLTGIMTAFTRLLNPAIFAIILLAVFGMLIFSRRWYRASLLFFGLLGGFFLEIFIKFIMRRPRPAGGLIHVSGYSFPSGHATMAAIFFLWVAYEYSDSFRKGLPRVSFIFTSVLLMLLIAFSRIYLGVHWLSDVIAGLALGTFWFTLLLLLLRVLRPWLRKQGLIERK